MAYHFKNLVFEGGGVRGIAYAGALEVLEEEKILSDDWQRTIYIDTLDVKATDFDLSDEKKNALLESGRNYTKSYLEWFNNDEEKDNKVK